MAKAPRRVSLKGKGADIFFGDYAPPGSEDVKAAGEVSDRPEEMPPPPVADTPHTEVDPAVAGEIEAVVVPGPAEVADAQPEQVSKQIRQQEGVQTRKISRKEERKKADLEESMSARTQEAVQASTRHGRSNIVESDLAAEAPEPGAVRSDVELVGDVGDEIWETLDQPATMTNSFRYVSSELEGITDALYAIGKEQGVKLTRQDVARLGLNVVLDDYRRRGASSLLVQLARRRQRRPGGRS